MEYKINGIKLLINLNNLKKYLLNDKVVELQKMYITQ